MQRKRRDDDGEPAKRSMGRRCGGGGGGHGWQLGLYYCLVVACSCVVATQAQAHQAPRTDPVEAAALSAILGRWGTKPPKTWNITGGDPCTGTAVDDTDIDNNPIVNPGIKCDCTYNNKTVCHIIKLRVYSLDVVGPIPAELENLTYLANLNLQQNYLTGTVPSFIGKLTFMQYLTLGINSLSGPLPKELGNLTNLRSLGVSTNKFVGPLPEEILTLTKLEQLYIDSCGLSGELPPSFSKFRSLKILWASDNELTGFIPDYFGSFSDMEDLRIQGNNFDGPIPASLSNLSKLRNLRIGDLIGGISSMDFLSNMTYLIVLILRNCRIYDNLTTVNFSNFPELTYLDLSFNSITGKIPPTLFNMSILESLFLGNNNLSGNLPDSIGPSLSTMNLVWNNFVVDSSNSSILPLGLNCLQRDTPCFHDSPEYSFAIDSGGESFTRGSDKNSYERNTGKFTDAPNASYLIYTPYQFNNTLDSKLFQTARMSPSSLRYYGIGLKNGFYDVKLQFAEIFFPDDQTWKSVGKRIFDIYIQGELREKDFDIKKDTNGKSYTVVQRQYNVEVTKNFMEIHPFWAGKGTCCIPSQGYYGPSISALSVSSYGEEDPGQSKNNTSGENTSSGKRGLVVGLVVGAIILGSLALTGTFVWRQRSKRLEVEMEELLSIVGRPDIFSYREIKSATNNFSPQNILGKGGYGHVYKGKLLDGRIVAVKQLSTTSHQGKKEFMTEIATISAVQHRNLVRLHGCCTESNTPLLVYEYLEKGSLDRAIFGILFFS
ncbi:probable LRR receptor-like serine/threonine-protein kinase At1g56140 isoform X1 [Oryza glaberrima]|uniref:probable LRR receptor-like serine/threonine-protein kinase At1g56140 isoform X1 n=1 Tax=Oryza glaberrima TaxID=4538 RepID=UPI00224C0419|nr:probable LRR receptor-like serine/threonine-protein kinase At1g56140 isoform X1 [Oryza glaberrima]